MLTAMITSILPENSLAVNPPNPTQAACAAQQIIDELRAFLAHDAECMKARDQELAALRANFAALAAARKAEFDAQAAEIAHLNAVIDELRAVRSTLARQLAKAQPKRRDPLAETVAWK